MAFIRSIADRLILSLAAIYRVLKHEGFRATAGRLSGRTGGACRQDRSVPVSALPAPHEDERSVLVIDAYIPMPDRDSGSCRMQELLQILKGFSLRVFFVPQSLCYRAPYTANLVARGIEVPLFPNAGSLEKWLKINGRCFDMVVLSRAAVADRYMKCVRANCPGAVIVFDTVDLHFIREEGQARLEHSRLLKASARARKRQELGLARQADWVFVVSDAEKDILVGEIPDLKVAVISNIHHISEPETGFRERSGLLFIGNYNHPPNVDAMKYFTREVFSGLRERLPGIELTVVGANMGDKLEECRVPGIRLVGHVPDINQYIDRARISIAPLRYGAGVKGKVNLCMSRGLPVVAMPVATEGMHVVDDEDILIAHSAREYMDKVAGLYNDPARWSRISRNGLVNIASHFSVSVARERLSEVREYLGRER